MLRNRDDKKQQTLAMNALTKSQAELDKDLGLVRQASTRHINRRKNTNVQADAHATIGEGIETSKQARKAAEAQELLDREQKTCGQRF